MKPIGTAFFADEKIVFKTTLIRRRNFTSHPITAVDLMFGVICSYFLEEFCHSLVISFVRATGIVSLCVSDSAFESLSLYRYFRGMQLESVPSIARFKLS